MPLLYLLFFPYTLFISEPVGKYLEPESNHNYPSLVMNTALNTGTSQNDWNIDRALLFIIPLVFISVLIWMPEEWLLESSMLCISIFTYILITYKQRLVYGFSGIRIASIPSTIIATFTFFISVPAIYVLMIREHPNEVPYFYSILLFYFLLCLLYSSLWANISCLQSSKVVYKLC